MQTKLSIYLNEIFKYIVLFLISFVWINFYWPNFLGSVVVAIVISSLISYGLSFVFYKKQEKLMLNNQDKKQMKNASVQFIFNNFNENIEFFNEVFKSKNIPTKITDYGIILYPNTPNSILFYPAYSSEELTESIVINAYKQLTFLNANKCIISGIRFSQNAQNLANSLKDVSIILFNEVQTYKNFLKPFNKFPENKVNFKSGKKMTKQLFFNMLLNKNNSKHYFYAGFLMLFCSMFLKMSTYYVIFSTILFLLSLLSFYSDSLTNQKQNFKIFKN